MVCSHSFVGVAPGEAPKAEATELTPEAVGAGPPDSDYNPGSLNRSPRRAFLDDNAFGGTSEPRLWAIHAKIGHVIRSGSISTAAGWAGRKIPASKSFCRLRCGPCEPACVSWSGAPRLARIRRWRGTGPDGEPASPHSAAVRRAAADGACRLAHPPERSGSAGPRKKTCNRCRSHAARRDTGSRINPDAHIGDDADWETRLPALRNVHSTPASTRLLRKRWLLPAWTL